MRGAEGPEVGGVETAGRASDVGGESDEGGVGGGVGSGHFFFDFR